MTQSLGSQILPLRSRLIFKEGGMTRTLEKTKALAAIPRRIGGSTKPQRAPVYIADKSVACPWPFHDSRPQQDLGHQPSQAANHQTKDKQDQKWLPPIATSEEESPPLATTSEEAPPPTGVLGQKVQMTVPRIGGTPPVVVYREGATVQGQVI